jgi:hypothetical protein
MGRKNRLIFKREQRTRRREREEQLAKYKLR